MSTRPICVHCRKPYGRRDVESVTVKWPLGKPMPPYQGNGTIVKIGRAYVTSNRGTVSGAVTLSSNASVRGFQEADLAKLPEHSENVTTLWVWDGKTYLGGYDPFCTLRCALSYARAAYADKTRTRLAPRRTNRPD